MAEFRMINTGIWEDEWFVSLDALEQHLFMYFLTNSATNIAGVYKISLRRAAFDTGMDSEKIKKILKRFEDDGKLFYEIGYVILPNWLRHQRLNPNQWKAVANLINALPDWLKLQLHDVGTKCSISFERLSQRFLTLENGYLSVRNKRREEKSSKKTSSSFEEEGDYRERPRGRRSSPEIAKAMETPGELEVRLAIEADEQLQRERLGDESGKI